MSTSASAKKDGDCGCGGSNGPKPSDDSKKSGSTKVTHLSTTRAFTDAINTANKVVVVDFFTTWCGPCKLLAKTLLVAAEKYPQINFYKVDCDELPDLQSSQNVEKYPTVKFYLNGKAIYTQQGPNADALNARLQQYAFFGITKSNGVTRGNGISDSQPPVPKRDIDENERDMQASELPIVADQLNLSPLPAPSDCYKRPFLLTSTNEINELSAAQNDFLIRNCWSMVENYPLVPTARTAPRAYAFHPCGFGEPEICNETTTTWESIRTEYHYMGGQCLQLKNNKLQPIGFWFGIVDFGQAGIARYALIHYPPKGGNPQNILQFSVSC